MRQTTSLIGTMIEQAVFGSFLLVTLNFKGTIFNLTTLPFDVTLGEIVYDSDNNLLSIEPPKIGNSLTKDTYTIKFADPHFIFRPYCTNAASSLLKVTVGFVNSSLEAIVGTNGTTSQLGQPIFSPQDMVLVYEGKIDSLQYVMDEDTGIVLEIKATSPMGALDASNVFYTTAHALLQRSPSAYDTAFDNVTIDSKAQLLLWGKVD